MTFDLTDRRIYGFATDEHLRFADLDANGHINNGAFIELLENARVSYLRQIVRSGLPRFRLVIGRIEADFKRQMFYPGRATACAMLCPTPISAARTPAGTSSVSRQDLASWP